jgi:hypothetical protein
VKLFRWLFLALVSLFVIVGCAFASDPASGVVLQYLKSMVAADNSQVSKLVCKEFEDQAVKDSDSFAGVKAELKGASCQKSGSDGSAVLVTCAGKIIATYGNENQEFDLAGPVYRVTQQGSSWLVCGRQ